MTSRHQPGPGSAEFVALMALMMSLVALSIDSVLPALQLIGGDLGVVRANDSQLILSVLFLGLTAGQVLYGPLSDSIGRKPAIFGGVCLFTLGCLLSAFATSFEVMLLGRFFQGMGAAGPRIVTVALIRDKYEGREMARVMSFVMTVFIMVPAVAPAFGQGLLLLFHWRAIFVAMLILALMTTTWLAIRQPETLLPGRRKPFSIKRIASAVAEVCRNPASSGYILAMGCVFGCFLGFLNSTFQLFQDLYNAGTRFPLYFAILALSVGCATLTNTRLIMRYGVDRLTGSALSMISLISFGYLVILANVHGQPPLPSLMGYFIVIFFFFGILFGNLNAQAMKPLGHIAGIGAAVVGSLSTCISLPVGLLIGQLYNQTVYPLVCGFAFLSLLALLATRWAERPRKKQKR